MDIEPIDFGQQANTSRWEINMARNYGVNACREFDVEEVTFSGVMTHQFERHFTVNRNGFLVTDADETFEQYAHEAKA